MIDFSGNQIDDITEFFSDQIYFTVVQVTGYVELKVQYRLSICVTRFFFYILFYCSSQLIVKLSKTPPQIESANDSNQNESTTESSAHQGMELTQEQLDMLYEEPETMTTNAMRAVYGHDPTDDRRLCPHYDPQTGGCWKGNTCTYEHAPKLSGE